MNACTRIVFVVFAFMLAYPAAASNAQDSKKNRPPVFRIGVETVFVNVTVADTYNRYVTGLEKEHFRIFEDRIEQSITYFSQEPAPISVGIILDVSSSMKDDGNIQKAKSAIGRFLINDSTQDEYFLMTFNHEVTLLHDFTNRATDLQNAAAWLQPGGQTALYDAVYRGVDHALNGRNTKKAIIVITDGEDNSSRYSPREVRELARESDVQIYVIGQQGRLGYGIAEIKNLVSITGGRPFFPNNFNELEYYIDIIHAELRSQYLLGYTPSNLEHDGKWRRINVRLEPPQGLPRLSIHAREGYYAPGK
jgi:Ca-activated chloride channel homolog